MKKLYSTLAALVIATSLSPFFLQSTAKAVEVSFEEDRSLPIVFVNVAIKAGSVTDPDGQSGITNFMGEMLLRGTKSKSKAQIDLALDQMGANLSVEARAEALIIRGAVLSSQLKPFLALVKEIITEPSFPKQEIGKLRKEIISGILEELGEDSGLASRRFTTFLFQGHPYGKPVIGKTKDVEKFDREKILAQYNRLINERNILIVGQGDASGGEIKNWGTLIGKLRPTGNQPAIAVVAPPENAPTRRLQIIDKPERTQTQINIGQIGLLMTDPDYFPLYLGNYAFGGGSFSARLMVEIRVKRGWSYGAYSSFRQGLKPRSWSAHLFPAAKDSPAALAETLQLIEALQKDGITVAEFRFAQASLVNSSGFMYNTPQKRVENTLLERTLNLPKGFMQSYAKRLSSVTRDETNRALKSFLKPDKLAISVLGTASQLKAKLAEASHVPEKDIVVVPYTQD
jgi:zinc protease